MKKMKKLNLNKVRIVSLKNVSAINGGNQTDTCPSKYSIDPVIDCNSTGITYGGNDGGTLDAAPPPQSNDCSKVLTECELAPM